MNNILLLLGSKGQIDDFSLCGFRQIFYSWQSDIVFFCSLCWISAVCVKRRENLCGFQSIRFKYPVQKMSTASHFISPGHPVTTSSIFQDLITAESLLTTAPYRVLHQGGVSGPFPASFFSYIHSFLLHHFCRRPDVPWPRVSS